MSKPFKLLVTYGDAKFTLDSVKVYEALDSTGLIPEKADIYDLVKNIKNAIDTSSQTDTPNYLVAPDGTKYLSSIDNSGNIIGIPLVPNKVLFLGNSLLLGHGTFGMCAKDSKHDYYHYVTQEITRQNPNATYDRLQAATYEGMTESTSAKNYLESTLKPKLDENINLVVVQLGDNVNTSEKISYFLEEGCINLLRYIRTNCPKARVVWMGEWYGNAEKQACIKGSCASTGSEFVNISDLVTSANQGKMGDIITADNGEQHEVTSAGVASHPGNLGMLAIANRLLYRLGLIETEGQIIDDSE